MSKKDTEDEASHYDEKESDKKTNLIKYLSRIFADYTEKLKRKAAARGQAEESTAIGRGNSGKKENSQPDGRKAPQRQSAGNSEHEDHFERKEQRKNEVMRQGLLLGSAAIVIIVMIVVALQPEPETKKTASEAAGQTAEAEATPTPAEEWVEEPFINILEKNNTEIGVSWGEAIRKTSLTEILGNLEKEIGAMAAGGYSVSFLLYDVNTGGGISYKPDEIYYSASAIKAPYVAWMAETYPEAAEDYYTEIENAIMWSSNEDYFALINNFGKTGFNNWAADAGSPDIELSDGSFGPVTCRDFTRLWLKIYDFFTSGNESAAGIRDLYTGTDESPIYEALGGGYTVYSKAGWSYDEEEPYYTVQNDAGIVMKGAHPYILTIMSDAYEELELLEGVVEELDLAHSELLAQERYEKSGSSAPD